MPYATHPVTAFSKEISEDEVDAYREQGWSVASREAPAADQSREPKDHQEADADQPADTETAESMETAEKAQAKPSKKTGSAAKKSS